MELESCIGRRSFYCVALFLMQVTVGIRTNARVSFMASAPVEFEWSTFVLPLLTSCLFD